MHLTLHLTNRCNLACSYCFETRGPERMTKDVAYAAVKFGMQNTNTSGLLFYGGEPLLERALIESTVAYTQRIKAKTKHNFFYKMTTNGLLLDESFLQFAQGVNLTIGFSHDGPAQDDCRKLPSGEGSFAQLQNKIPLLLRYQPYAVGMCVIDPTTAHRATEIVQFLYAQGFRYITVGINYSPSWTDERLAVLQGEYEKMAALYLKWTQAEEKFYLSPFDMKILSHLKGEGYNIDRRRMAQNQLSVAPDGKLYPSSRALGDPQYCIGDVFEGINRKRQQKLYDEGDAPAPCKRCALRTRCNYCYDNLPDISPVQCAHERMLTPIADRVAEQLYRKNSAMFFHKHYNELYAVMSLVEDTSTV